MISLIHGHKHRVRQNEETEQYGPNERTGQNHSRRSKQNRINMMIKILTGFQKSVEGITETLDKEIKNNISKMKNSINETKNTLDEINSRI